MKKKKYLLVNIITAIALVTLTMSGSGAVAQQRGIRRTELQRHDLNVPWWKETIKVRIDFEPGAAFGNHSHPAKKLYMCARSID